jgi:outer membrane receptor protein involved in Fe transport
MKKIMTLVIGVSLLFPSGALFAKERQGAKLIVTKTDGTEIKGELIGVKQDSALLLKSPSVPGGSIDISDIKVIKIVKGSNTVAGVLLGLLAGGATGTFIGYSIGYNETNQDLSDWWKEGGGVLGAIIGGGIGLLAGGLLGGAYGSTIHNHETLQIEGKSQEQIKAVLEKLRTQAAFPEYQ